MTLIFFGALAGALIASLLVDLDRRNRKHTESRHQAIRQRVLASQADLHRAAADKLIPRFAKDGAPGGEGPM